MTSPVMFQNMPPLSPEEYSELESSIREHGIQVPVLEDEAGVVVDGHHRQKIAEHLGIECPRQVLRGKSDAEKRTLALSLNVHRRHLNREQKRALIAESIKADPALTDREHAGRTSVSPSTVGSVRESLEDQGEVSKLDTRRDPRGYEQPAERPRRTATGHSGAAWAGLGEEIPTATSTTYDLGTGEVMDERPYQRPEAPREPVKQKRRPLTDRAVEAAMDLEDMLDTLIRISKDDRFPTNSQALRDRLKINRPQLWDQKIQRICDAYGLNRAAEMKEATHTG